MGSLVELMDNTLDCIHATLFDMMTAFDNLCKKYHLTYYLIGGSALGALRHNGFIPWDDDVDLALPRKDFERMEEVLGSIYDNKLTPEFTYQPVEHTGPIGYLNFYMNEINDTISIDIHPLDFVPDSFILQKIQQLMSQVFYVATYRTPPKNKGEFAKKAIGLFLAVSNATFLNWIEKISKNIITYWNKKGTNTLSNLYGLAGYKKEKVPCSFFGNPIYHKFESGLFPIPEKCHEYMTHIYGDYMVLPPIEKRIPKHLQMKGDI